MVKLPLRWHGDADGRFSPIPSGTDYVHFEDTADGGYAEVLATLIDGVGRIVYNLRCQRCGYVDVLKTHSTRIHPTAKFLKNVDTDGWFEYNKLNRVQKVEQNESDHRWLEIDVPSEAPRASEERTDSPKEATVADGKKRGRRDI